MSSIALRLRFVESPFSRKFPMFDRSIVPNVLATLNARFDMFSAVRHSRLLNPGKLFISDMLSISLSSSTKSVNVLVASVCALVL